MVSFNAFNTYLNDKDPLVVKYAIYGVRIMARKGFRRPEYFTEYILTLVEALDDWEGDDTMIELIFGCILDIVKDGEGFDFEIITNLVKTLRTFMSTKGDIRADRYGIAILYEVSKIFELEFWNSVKKNFFRKFIWNNIDHQDYNTRCRALKTVEI